MSFMSSTSYIKNINGNLKYISICPHCYHYNHFDNNINIKSVYCYGCSCSIKIIKLNNKINFLYETIPENDEDIEYNKN